MTPTIAVLDWGIGGIDFHARLTARAPTLATIYWSDSGSTPYGKLGREALARRVAAVAGQLRARGATHLVIACNAASTVLGHPTLAGCGLELCGVIAPAIAATLADPSRVVGVIGGRRTIRSGLYRRALVAAGRRVHARVAQPLSALVERGELDTPLVRAELARILGPLRRVEALVLACTHYTALLRSIREVLPTARMIDPAAATLAHVAATWSLKGQVRSDMFLTTGDPGAMREAAARAFGARLPAIERAAL